MLKTVGSMFIDEMHDHKDEEHTVNRINYQRYPDEASMGLKSAYDETGAANHVKETHAEDL